MKKQGPKVICHLITGTQVGGAETALANLLAAAGQSEFRQVVVGLQPAGPRAEDMARSGAKVESLGLAARPRALAAGLVRLRCILAREKPDIMQTWMYHADLVGLLASRFGRALPLVWSLRASDLGPAGLTGSYARLVGPLARLSRLPAAVVANSRAGLAYHRSIGYRNRNFRVIPNGFDLERFAPRPEERARARAELGLGPGAILFGMAARYDFLKNHAGFLRAAALVAREEPGARFAFIGQGMQEDNPALAPAQEPPLAGRCHFLGPRRRMPRWYNALDWHVNCSLSEGFCNAVGESMACGTPNLASDVGDNGFLLGDTGRVFSPRRDQPLAEAMLWACRAGEEARLALGRLARQRVERHFSLENMWREHRSLYLSLLGLD